MRAYFYHLVPHRREDINFDQCAHQLHNQLRAHQGEYIHCDNVYLRLERYHRETDYCTGDIIRQQRDDIPPSAPDGGALQPSDVPVGHRTAFLYNYSRQVLVFQVNKNGVGVGKLLDCMARSLNHNGFAYHSLINQSSLDDLLGGNTRRITVKYAAPTNPSAVERAGVSDLDNLERMRRLFDAPSIEVVAGFDTPKPGHLNQPEIMRFIKQVMSAPVQVRKIEIKQEDSAELLDLLGKKLSYADDNVQLDSTNIQRHYTVRKHFLEQAFINNRTTIEQWFRTAAA